MICGVGSMADKGNFAAGDPGTARGAKATAAPRCLHAIVHGRVQGVFFRASTQKVARRLGVTGWVRNCSDGTVEVMASGDEAALQNLLAWLHQGPPMARVTQVVHEMLPCRQRFDDFEIKS